MLIRPEEPTDHRAVREIHTATFETPAEARLVEALRERTKPLVSLVAVEGDEVLGHILFSPVSLPELPHLELMGLAPMAVAPGHQRRGIGSALVREGLEACRRLGAGAVVVLGHPDYYPRFGFEPSVRFGIGCEYDVPPEVFMALELQPEILRNVSGTVQYHQAFREL
ncbi:MAG: N-acetyltransferase [Acidobacteriota bacterium]|nr:N-acetyltransferase [Acidobacteriota bacterium]